LTFTSFVNAKSNHFAFSLASDVANTPGVNYNPLYMFSKLSLGKTHLLNAIGNHILNKNPLAKVIYLTLNQLSSDFSNSIRNGKLGEFREFYKNYEILLIDYIHLVAGKERLQKELIYIFDHYYESKKQIAVTGKLPPRHIKNLLPELRSRLEWGLLCELQVPDHSTRMKIIKKKAEEEKISIPDDVIFFLANSTNDLKTVVRYLINLETYASLNKRKLNISIAKSIIKNSPFSKINVNDVQKLTADYFNISVSDLLSNKKTQKFSYPRHVAMYLSRELTGLPFKELAKSFGDKDHSTIIYAVKRIEKDKEKTKVVMNDVNKLQDLLS
ncbi:MAG: chromosomal replication initiator protein DnaA, partial [Candidatus Hermodarchaeota archaeon]